MKTTGIFETLYFPIKVAKSGEPFYIIPLGDIHRYAPLCHEEKYFEILDWLKTKERAYVIGMGDYMDLMSASERSILERAELHDSSKETIDSMYQYYTEKFANELKFLGKRLIGLIEGNHYAVLRSGQTTTQYACHLLGTKYLGASAFIRLAFDYSGTSQTVDMWCHHGKGAARLIGGSLNRVQQMAEAANADIYCMGHDHKKSAGTCSKLVLSGAGDNLKVRHKKQLFIRSGSFLKGYEKGKVSYVVDSAMNPTDLGVTKIEITPKKSNGEYTIDLHASI